MVGQKSTQIGRVPDMFCSSCVSYVFLLVFVTGFLGRVLPAGPGSPFEFPLVHEDAKMEHVGCYGAPKGIQQSTTHELK